MKDFDDLNKELLSKFPNLKETLTDTEEDKIGSLIFSKRIQHKLTQEDLAKFACVHVENIYRIEGGSKVDKNILDKVLNVFK